MTLAVGNPQGPVVSAPVLVVLLIGGSVIYALGYAHAVWRRARMDYRATKAAVPRLRKAKWTLWTVMIRKGFWVVAALVVFVLWVIVDIRAER